MDNDYYTIKDIIFGLRPYYLDNEKKLEMLKDLCYSVDENVKDFSFYIQRNGKDYNLYCRYVHDINTLSGLITYLNVKNNIYVYGKNISKVTILDNGICYLDDKYFKVNIKNDKMDYFYKLAKKILDSNFVNNIKYNQYFDEKKPGVHINPCDIVIEGYYNDEPVTLQYLPKKDKIIVIGVDDTTIHKDLISSVLNYNIPKEELTEYMIQLIGDKNKKVFINGINDFNNVKQVDLNIIENDNQILLEKVKNKKKIRSYFV